MRNVLRGASVLSPAIRSDLTSEFAEELKQKREETSIAMLSVRQSVSRYAFLTRPRLPTPPPPPRIIICHAAAATAALGRNGCGCPRSSVGRPI